MFREFLKVLGKVVRREKGYTLIEVSAVVAITATLGAVIVPITLDKIEETKIASAANDVGSIGQAIQTLFQQTGDWPTRQDANNDDVFHVLYSATAAPTGGAGTPNVDSNVTNINLTSSGDTPIPNSDALYNHLIENGHEYVSWGGPYISADTYDPWGKSYVIYVRPLHKEDTSNDVAWILSGGPDGVIDTDISDITVMDDDIGQKLD